MDLGLYARVLWRFRFLVLAGLLASLALAFLSYARVDLDGGAPRMALRGEETWQSTALLQVSEPGFPPGVSVLKDPVPLQPGEEPEGRVYSEPARFQELAILYAKFAESDNVKRLVGGRVADSGTYYAQPVKTDDGAFYTPFVLITATSTSPEAARDLAGGVTNALRAYIQREQRANAIPAERRAELLVVNEAQEATLIAGRSFVLPMFILLFGIAATLGLAFVLENLRPRVRPAPAPAATLHAGPDRRVA